MLGGEREPEGMIFQQEYDYEDDYGQEYDDDKKDEFMMGGSRERKMSNLQIPEGQRRNRNYNDNNEDGAFPLGNMEDISPEEMDSQMYSMIHKQNSS